MKKISIVTVLIVSFFLMGCTDVGEVGVVDSAQADSADEAHPLVFEAREQIGVVIKYDTAYYSGGYPPADRGACTDVIEGALRASGYDLKGKIDADMQSHPERYSHDSDPNINYRRVRNVKVFLDYYAESFTLKTDAENIGEWQPGDIVTYDQIPGSLWHIAIISDKKNSDDVPLLIHNYSRGVVEDDKLLTWPAPISGHYRLRIRP